MRNQKKLAPVLRAVNDPDLAVDDRPTKHRWLHGFIVGAAIFFLVGFAAGCLWSWHVWHQTSFEKGR